MSELSVVYREYVDGDSLGFTEEIIFNDGMRLVYSRYIDWWEATFYFALYRRQECVAVYRIEGSANAVETGVAVEEAKQGFGTYAKYIDVAQIK